GHLLAGLEGDEGAGCLAPSVVGLGDHGGFEYRRVAVEHTFDLDGGNVLATGDDDVLEAVLDLHVTILMPHAQVAGMEPATFEGFGGGARVLQVALHHGIAAHEDLTDGLAILGHRLQGLGVGNHDPFQGCIAHTLAGFDIRALLQRQLIPLAMPGADSYRTVGLGQAVDVGDLDAHFFHRTDYLGRRRCARDHGVHWMVDGGLGFRWHVDQGVEHDGRAAQVSDLLLVDQVEDLLRVDPAQEYMHASHGGDGPGVAPAVAVAHRQGPQVDRMLAQIPGHLVAQGVEERAAVMID